LSPETRETLLEAIAKARVWIEDLVAGRVDSLAAIAWRENKGERHVRLLALLAFVLPPLVGAIVDGSAGPNLTITRLASRLPSLWNQPMDQALSYCSQGTRLRIWGSEVRILSGAP
jgi:site-specific DNA recombinase